jgi:hypothetical protein
MAQGKFDEALKVFDDSFVIVERLAASDRSNVEWQHGLAASHANYADLYERLGKIPEALAEAELGQAIMTALVAIAPGHAQWKAELGFFDATIERLTQAQEQARN